MKTKHVVVVPYDPLWKDAFIKIRDELSSILGDLYLSIEHVGSTSVVGLAAKPIIDIDIIIKPAHFDLVKEALESIGYHHEGNQGINDREALKYENKKHLMRHHLYVCPEGSLEYQRHLFLKDWLNTHPKDKDAYGKLKESLAEKYPYDIDSYIDGKTSFIEMIYEKMNKNKGS